MSIEISLKRLTLALDQLEAIQERYAQAEKHRLTLQEELAIMQDDRSKLAVELDAALARIHKLESTHQEIERRLERITPLIRSVLANAGILEEN